MQLGVNGYSFIVDNNGRVLYHPDLRTEVINILLVINSSLLITIFSFYLQNDESNYLESLKPKYKSTDLTEVELPETEPKKNNNNISDKEDENTNFLLDVSLIHQNVSKGLFNNKMIFFLDEARNGIAKRR